MYTLFLDLAQQLVDLVLVQQQLFHTKGVFVKNIPLLIRTYMHSVDEYFSVFNADERLLDTAFSHTHGLYFRTVQGNAALVGLVDEKS